MTDSMKTALFIISIFLISMLFSCNEGRQQQTLEEMSRQELANAVEERDQMLVLVKEVAEGLEQIKQLENIMTVTAAGPYESSRQKTQILTDLSNLREKIRLRRQRLREFEKRLEDSSADNKELRETIRVLRAQIDFQMAETEALRRQLLAANEHIGALTNAMDSLHSEFSNVEEERDAAKYASEKLENELNTCYYVVASKSELKKHNILESGFLRKTRLMKGAFDKGFFIISDKRVLDELPLSAKSVKILTSHPDASYEFIERNGKRFIRIKNPEQFWSLTDYLVVQND